MAEKAEKMTKAKWFKEIIDIVKASEDKNKDAALEFLNKQITQLTDRAEKAKERATKKRTEGDELQAAVEAVLTDEFQSIDVITAQVDFEDVSRAKVVSRLRNLMDDGRIEKGNVKEGSRKVVAYRTI